MKIFDVNDPEMLEFISNLEQLNYIKKERHRLGYEHKRKLIPAYSYDKTFFFDSCGNTSVRCKGELDTYSSRPIPGENDKCPYCGTGFRVKDILSNCIPYTKTLYTEDGYDVDIEFYHSQCNLFMKHEKQLEEFRDILTKVYSNNITLKPIPNRYCDCDKCAPWYKVNTPDGDIIIGWRKRVINIQWLDNYRFFTETFDSENVTKEFDDCRLIHAWSCEKAVEYLIRAKKSIK